MQHFELNRYRFDDDFAESLETGTAFMTFTPFDKNLAENLQIKKSKITDPDLFSKEVAIGLADSHYSNKIDLLHFTDILSFSGQQQV